jgi:signal transduction histidine kinase
MEIFQSMHDGVCILSPDYTIETLNPALAASLGVEVSSVIGKKCYTVFMGRDHRCEDCPLQETWTLGAPSNDTKFLTPPSNEGFSTEMYTLPLASTPDSRAHVFCYMKDLSKEMRLKDKLTQSRKLATVGQMAAGIAHEIRNPLISIRSSIEMLQENPSFDEEERTLAGIIHTEAVQLERVIREFLAYAQPPQLERSRVQLNEIIQDIFREIERRGDFAHVTFETSLAPDLPEGYLDGHQMRQILWNLLQNASDALQGTGLISVSTYWKTSGNGFRRKSLFLTVEDTGQGFDESLKEKMFKPFFTTKGNGLGMGLALVQQSVEAQDGEIHVASEVGKGTRFTIRFPLIS